jgi:uncharacterized 2Fe-2S/4Fe-4S cluster protein (DUF4445 family)
MCLLIDIGTNGEVFIGNSKDIVSCSCAAGPAFEGMHIEYGMKASTGAIDKIKIDPDVPTEKIHFVGNTAISGAKMVLTSEKCGKSSGAFIKDSLCGAYECPLLPERIYRFNPPSTPELG